MFAKLIDIAIFVNFYWYIYQAVNGHHSPLLQPPRLLDSLLLFFTKKT
jgi:hypothetical protein